MQLIGSQLLFLDTVDSTNTWLRLSQPHRPWPDGTVVVAEHQRAGRGQQGNRWEAPAGDNLTLSVLIYPRRLQATHSFMLNKMTALAVAGALQALDIPDVQVKWPNDVLIGGRKAAGILIENSVQGSLVQHSILGIGLNVQSSPAGLPATHTQLHHPAGKSELLELLLQQLNAWYLKLQQLQYAALDEAYWSQLWLRERPHTFWQADTAGNEVQITGRIVGISPQGLLNLETEAGIRQFDLKQIRFG